MIVVKLIRCVQWPSMVLCTIDHLRVGSSNLLRMAVFRTAFRYAK
jgi:hypothetical protein